MSSEPIKALDTPYKGYRMRSRTEARWAVFFDALAIPYRYEHRGAWHELQGGYLPDFLVTFGGIGPVWTEIKPYLFQHGDASTLLTHDAARTLAIMDDLCHLPIEQLDIGACPGLLLGGDPAAGARGILVWPKDKGTVHARANIGRCSQCKRFCFFVEMGCPVTRYALNCRCHDSSFAKVRILTKYAEPYICDLAIVEAASIARSTRFDPEEAPALSRKLRNPIGSRGETSIIAKLTIEMVRDARKRYHAGEPLRDIARSLKVHESTVSRAVHGKTWKHVA